MIVINLLDIGPGYTTQTQETEPKIQKNIETTFWIFQTYNLLLETLEK